MAHCEIVRVGTPGGASELRLAPPSEPLASCAFEWPVGWTPHTVDWSPPPLFRRAPLVRLEDGSGGALSLSVARFGVEVDGLAFLRRVLGRDLENTGWRGLPVAAAEETDVAWRVVHSGPALHVLAARGGARLYVEHAAASLRGLSGLGPEAEPVKGTALGPVRFARLGAWKLERELGTPHGYHRLHLRLMGRQEELFGYLRVLAIDRRVHVDLDVRPILEKSEAAHDWAGLSLGDRRPDPGAGGVAHTRHGVLGDVPVEARGAVRQIGPGIVLVNGLWPSFEHAPIGWLNGRRHFDIVLATLRA